MSKEQPQQPIVQQHAIDMAKHDAAKYAEELARTEVQVGARTDRGDSNRPMSRFVLVEPGKIVNLDACSRVHVEKPSLVECAGCRGSGRAVFQDRSIPCTTCRGAGRVTPAGVKVEVHFTGWDRVMVGIAKFDTIELAQTFFDRIVSVAVRCEPGDPPAVTR